MSVANTYEPNPKHNNNEPVWESVIEKYSKTKLGFPKEYKEDIIKLFKERDEFGRNKQGTPLQPYNGRNPVNDLMGELLDAIVYSYQAYVECQDDIVKTSLYDIHRTAITMFENLYLIQRAGK